MEPELATITTKGEVNSPKSILSGNLKTGILISKPGQIELPICFIAASHVQNRRYRLREVVREIRFHFTEKLNFALLRNYQTRCKMLEKFLAI
jgi:hypothetical protein